MWDGEQVGAAIDETARQMTAGEPGTDLRVRVMARVEAGSGLGVRVFAFRMWRPASAGLTVAALILIAVMIRPQPDANRPGPAPAPEVRLKPDATYQEVRLPPSPLGGYGGPRKPDATYEMKLPSPSEVDAVALPPIDLEPIAVAALPAGESIHVEPLQTAAPIAVARLSPEIEGDPR